MKTVIARPSLAVFALLCSPLGIAATVTVVPPVLTPQVGDTFTVRITADVPNTFAATMDLAFNASTVEYVSGVALSPWNVFIKNSPVTENPTVINVEAPTGAIGANPGVYNVAELTFRVIAGGAANILINDDGGTTSGWFDADTADYIPNTYVQASIVIPSITVTDSVVPANDLLVAFGPVSVGTISAARTVTVRNSGSQNLLLGGVALANPLAPPYTLVTDTCSSQNLAPAATCTLTIDFSPAAEGNALDTFDIPSNDPARPTVTVSVSGTGFGIGDPIPDSFAFVDQSGVTAATQVTSNAVTVSGINVPAAISVSGDDSSAYSINGGAFTAVPGTVTNGSSVRVRHTTSAAPDTAVDTVLNIGGVTDTFTSKTLKYAIDDAVTVLGNQTVVIDVLQNDIGLLPSVFVGIWINPLHGTAVVNPFPPASPSVIRITYTPNPGFYGLDSFEYWLETGPLVDYARVNVTVLNPDLDGDGVLNTVDNCTLVINPSQCDSDGDGYGNRCDGDHTGNGLTNAQDTVVMRQLVQDSSVPPTYNRGDINCNGRVNAQDVTLFRQLLGKPPGPSGLVP